MNDERTMSAVEQKMRHLGFTQAAEKLRDRWLDYNAYQRKIIKERWGL